MRVCVTCHGFGQYHCLSKSASTQQRQTAARGAFKEKILIELALWFGVCGLVFKQALKSKFYLKGLVCVSITDLAI
jgi:hypothetical protein